MGGSRHVAEETLEYITPDGNLQNIGFDELKALCFATDTATADLFTSHNFFERRPKSPGLWTRFTFKDGDRLDGILSHNLLEWPRGGYLITPPRAGSTRQRVFIPRPAVVDTELRGVVGRSAWQADKLPALKYRKSRRSSICSTRVHSGGGLTG